LLFGTQTTYRSESQEIGKKWERNINKKKSVYEKEKEAENAEEDESLE
jgi:hypothetical protein